MYSSWGIATPAANDLNSYISIWISPIGIPACPIPRCWSYLSHWLYAYNVQSRIVRLCVGPPQLLVCPLIGMGPTPLHYISPCISLTWNRRVHAVVEGSDWGFDVGSLSCSLPWCKMLWCDVPIEGHSILLCRGTLYHWPGLGRTQPQRLWKCWGGSFLGEIVIIKHFWGLYFIPQVSAHWVNDAKSWSKAIWSAGLLMLIG